MTEPLIEDRTDLDDLSDTCDMICDDPPHRLTLIRDDNDDLDNGHDREP